ncbi:MAG TPA: hypothetical protein VFI79_13875 [Gemmatimonadales bacterium]|nr:hypothetical protein [Gemmatimonadales bacterium]
MSVLTGVSLVTALIGALLVALAVWAGKRRKLLHSIVSVLTALFCLALAGVFASVTIGIHGYRALTAEEVAAVVQTEPVGPQHFRATVTTPDGRVGQFDILGDALYVDARILKWKPVVNILGLQTAYELDRVGGRYNSVPDERRRPHTVFPLGQDHFVNVFGFVHRHPRILAPLVDASYGSGTFISVARPARYEVRVSTTGLLIRPVSDSTTTGH